MEKYNKSRNTRSGLVTGRGEGFLRGRYKHQAARVFWQFFILAAMVLAGAGPLAAQQQAYEAEAGVLANGASAQACASCSGGAQVGNLGGSTKGTLTQTVTVAAAGDYELTLSYASADPRTIFMAVNELAAVELPCQASGSWTTVTTTGTRVSLRQGANTIRFENPGGWAPNLDKFSLSPSPRYTVSGHVLQQGKALAGVPVTLSGATYRTATTDAQGRYAFADLPGGRNYAVTPTTAGKVFAPAYIGYAALAEHRQGQDFTAAEACGTCQQTFTFGGQGRIVYSTQTGTFSVLVGDREVIANAHAAVLNGSTRLTSMQYSQRVISQAAISDAFGTGTKTVVTLTGPGLPAMEQVFYAYEGKGYFLTEVVLRGSQVSSNYMAPLVANKADLGVTGDNRVLFVPFDNDTFIRYQSKAVADNLTNTSAEVTAFYDNNSRQGLVVGSVEHMDWKTGVKTSGSGSLLTDLTVWGGYTQAAVTRDAGSHGALAGTAVKSPRIFVGLFDDWREGLEAYGKANALSEPRYVFNWTKPTPFGWNSWGAIQNKLSLDKAKKVVDFFASSLPAFRNDNTAYIDLDSYWDNLISGGLEGDFSQLIAFVQHCKEKGLKPGIYWAPFVDWSKTNRRVEGSSYNYPDVWTRMNGGYQDLDGARAMDPTHPATRQRMDLVIDKFIRCGFEMIKIDFIGHAATEADSYYDPSVKTGMQAFRKGMEHLINTLDGKMLVYVAISPSLATGRYAHIRRIACDAYADINATEYTLNSTTYGWWQTHLYNYIDADHLVFGSQSAGENRARLTSGVLNGTLITGDDFSTSGPWTESAKSLLQHQAVLSLARNGGAFRPVEGNSESGASATFVKQIADDYYVAFINYGDARKIALSFSRLGIPAGPFSITELFSGSVSASHDGTLKADISTRDAAIFKLTAGIVNGVGPETPADTAVIFYPNPASKALHIKSDKNIQSLRVSSLTGALLTEVKEVKGKTYKLNLSAYPAGVYLVTLTEENGQVRYYKVIKQQ